MSAEENKKSNNKKLDKKFLAAGIVIIVLIAVIIGLVLTDPRFSPLARGNRVFNGFRDGNFAVDNNFFLTRMKASLGLPIDASIDQIKAALNLPADASINEIRTAFIQQSIGGN